MAALCWYWCEVWMVVAIRHRSIHVASKKKSFSTVKKKSKKLTQVHLGTP